MRVRVSNPARLHDLARHLRECGCVAEQASRNELDVFAPQTPNDQAARMEVEVYVSAWQVAHEDVEAQIIGE
jgi:hypothetical protein